SVNGNGANRDEETPAITPTNSSTACCRVGHLPGKDHSPPDGLSSTSFWVPWSTSILVSFLGASSLASSLFRAFTLSALRAVPACGVATSQPTAVGASIQIATPAPASIRSTTVVRRFIAGALYRKSRTVEGNWIGRRPSRPSAQAPPHDDH